MQKEKFSVQIKAPKEKVWGTLWNDQSYRDWTNVFYPGSHAVSDWNEGSKIQFLGPDGSGMYSVIDQMQPNEYMAFKHLGVVKDGKELENDEESKSWAGARETYRLTDREGVTQLDVELDTTEDHQQYFKDTFPKALEKVKEIAEG